MKGLVEISPLIRDVELAELLGVNRATVWTWNSGGKIPRPVKIGGATRWRASEIRAWIDAGCPGRGRWEAENERNP